MKIIVKCDICGKEVKGSEFVWDVENCRDLCILCAKKNDLRKAEAKLTEVNLGMASYRQGLANEIRGLEREIAKLEAERKQG